MSGREAAPLTLLGETSDTLLVAGGEGAEAEAENPALVDWGRSGRRIGSSLLQFEPARGAAPSVHPKLAGGRGRRLERLSN
jgi:hypothetical protein